MKKKGFKVVRSKHNVYRRKSKASKVLGAALFVLLLGGLVFVGYLAAPTVMDFISKGQGNSSDTSESVPQDISSDISQEISSGGESISSSEESDTSSEEDAEEKQTNSITVLAPSDATASLSALEAYLEEAKKQGCGSVMFEMKDENGQLLYRSDIAEIKGNTTVIKGTLTAQAIVNACRKSGITPLAAVTALCDKLAPRNIFGTGYYLTGTNYWHWLDAKSEDGGKPWVSPMRDETVKYITDITAELCKAGFDAVVLRDVKFPNFTQYDYTIIDAGYSDADRSDSLAELAAACASSAKASGKGCYVMIDAAELMCMSASEYDGTAEILASKDKLGECGIIVNMDFSAVGAQLETADGKTAVISSDPIKAVKQVFTSVKKLIGDNIAVSFQKGTVSDDITEKMSDELIKLGFESIIIS